MTKLPDRSNGLKCGLACFCSVRCGPMGPSSLEGLRKAAVPCSPIQTLDQALAHPQVQARQLIVESEHPVLGTVNNIGLPVRFRQGARAAQRPAPLLGEHTEEILQEAGFPAAQIARLARDGIVANGAPRVEAP
ncbi:CoA transferase [Cupriavidus necator]|uniref:CoA transferase n=1 Tax=Cupriavidus necator TaxID=106590 RepID=UPI0009B82E1B|nr:CoA transferase [Cupriavidus necator]